MDITKPFFIILEAGRHLAGKERMFTPCLISAVEITYKGVTVDFASVESCSYPYIKLISGTSFPKKDCDGKITFTTPGLSDPLTLNLSQINHLSEVGPSEGLPPLRSAWTDWLSGSMT